MFGRRGVQGQDDVQQVKGSKNMVKKEFTILVEGIPIKGRMVIPPDEGGQKVVVLCHGIPAGRKSPEEPGYDVLAENLAREGWRAVTFNFRGTGESGGNIDMGGWVRDLQAVLSWVEEIDKKPVLFGFSAGGAVAATVAGEGGSIGGIVLCAAPAAFDGIVSKQGPERFFEHACTIGMVRDAGFPEDFGAWVEGFRYASAEKMISRCLGIPTLIIHGTDDDVVPVEHAGRIYRAAAGPKEVALVEDAGHRLRFHEEAMNIAREWLKKLKKHGGS